MNYDAATKKYAELRAQAEAVEAEAKSKLAPIKESMVLLEQWFLAKATEDGIANIKTPHATVFWTTHATAAVASRAAFLDYCLQNDKLALLQVSCNKTAAAEHVKALGAPPPGVTYSTRKVMNFRAPSAAAE